MNETDIKREMIRYINLGDIDMAFVPVDYIWHTIVIANIDKLELDYIIDRNIIRLLDNNVNDEKFISFINRLGSAARQTMEELDKSNKEK